jgi:GT2 family glycosyltransferase
MSALISVIVTTYNWPQALEACLDSLFAQTDHGFEIIIADDGSASPTHELIARCSLRSPVTLQHIHHEDQGFRAAAIRNKAVAASQGAYLIFLDGDCVTLPHFIARHRALAEAGYFVPGNRLLLSSHFTATVLQRAIPLFEQSWLFFIKQRLCGHLNRLLPLCHIPWQAWRYHKPLRWQNAMTCNLGLWREDFMAVNGFDEAFEGWGYEDSDLVIRLIHRGVRRKEGRFAVPVLHLWHTHHDRSRHDENYQRLQARLNDVAIQKAERGVDQYWS